MEETVSSLAEVGPITQAKLPNPNVAFVWSSASSALSLPKYPANYSTNGNQLPMSRVH